MNQSDNESIFTVSAQEHDPLEAIVRRGARVMLEAALEHEVFDYLERSKHERVGEEKESRRYRNGYAPARTLTVGSGTIKVKLPRISDVPATQEPFA